MRITIKHIARAAGTSQTAVKRNVVELLVLLPMDERVAVLEYMYNCKVRKKGGGRMGKMLELESLPVRDGTDVLKFLGATDVEYWEACKEYEHRMKEGKDPHETFGLNKELIVQTADEVVRRNAEWLKEHVDKRDPMSLLSRLHEAPQDKLAMVLRLLRQHGFKQVGLATWVAADVFLSKWVEKKSLGLAKEGMRKLGFNCNKYRGP